MFAPVKLLTLAAAVGPAMGAYLGFNYGNTFTNGAIKTEADFEAEFKAAQSLAGAPGFTSARLYTMVQGGTPNAPIAAIQAAINTKTTLLLGLWASAGQDVINNELAALSAAIQQYGAPFCGLVTGISVGSEDLYRISPTGIAAGSNPGANPQVLASYISEVRNVIKGTCLASAPVGHVDTWTAWVNGSNQAVIDNCDFIGMDAYPYFQDTTPNAIGAGAQLFGEALGATQAAVGGRPVWVTETGWPTSGKTVGGAVPSVENAKTFWDDVGCNMLFGKTNTWWYTLQDAAPDTPNPSFGVVGSQLSNQPLFDLSCKNVAAPSSSSGAPSSSIPTGGSGGGAQTTSIPPGNGSPGVSGLPTSQISLEATATGSSLPPSSTGTGGGASNSTTGGGGSEGGGSNGGSGAAGSSTGPSTPSAPTTSPSPAGNDAGAGPGPAMVMGTSVGAAFAAVMAAILAL